MRCAGRVVRLRGERCPRAHLRRAPKVVERNHAGDQARQRRGNLRIPGVGKMVGSVDAEDVEAGSKRGGDLCG